MNATCQFLHPSPRKARAILEVMVISFNQTTMEHQGIKLAPPSTNALTMLSMKVKLSIATKLTNHTKSCTQTVTGNKCGTMKPRITFNAPEKEGQETAHQPDPEQACIQLSLMPTLNHQNLMLQQFGPSMLPTLGMPLLLHVMRKSDCAFKPLDQTLPHPRNKPLTDSLVGNSNPPQIGMCGRRASTSNSIKSTNKACLEIQSILQHLILMQSSSAQHGSVPSKEMELNNPCN